MLLDTPEADSGWPAADFSLPDTEGRTITLTEVRGEDGFLIAFICNHCPYVLAIIDRFVEDASRLQSSGIGVVAIMSNDYGAYPDDRPEKMIDFADQHNFTFPYLVDESQEAARNYGAVCTPDFFGFDRAGLLRYRGRLDDARMGDATNRDPELLNAMLSVNDPDAHSTTQHSSMGCSIKWRR
ncbi:MAG: thioredoxin family protein [Pseudomonadota bacterium]